LLLAVAAVRVKLNRKVRATTAVTWLVAVAVFVSWGLGMYCATSVVAQEAAGDYSITYSNDAWEYADQAVMKESLEMEAFCNNHSIWGHAYRSGANTQYSGPYTYRAGTGFLGRMNYKEVYPVTAVFDSEGNVITGTWKDTFFFPYGKDASGNVAYMRAEFDRDKLTEEGNTRVFSDRFDIDIAATRFTGYFDDFGFVLQKVECIDNEEHRIAVERENKKEREDEDDKPNVTLSYLIEEYGLVWRVLYEDASVSNSDGELVQLNGGSAARVFCAMESPGFTYQGEKYESVADYVQKIGPQALQGRLFFSEYENGEQFINDVAFCYSRDGELHFSYDWNGAYAQTDGRELHYYIVTVAYCRPWLAAMGQLRYVYLSAFMIALGFVVLLCRVIKRNMVMTLQEAIKTLDNTNERRTYIYDISHEWQESEQLIECLEKNRSLVLGQRDEIKRLTTALEYAKSAEENRRQMTSNIAHELKTPLAIIHSYAEGLKERIAEEKRDKYIDVILSETERTDAMVLQMLDLSRLEAGKVKLSQDTFSLIDMTKSIFDRLELAANAKELKIEFDFPKALDIVADEGRMAQVIENLATNAVKYTPAGGKIRVEGYSGRNGTVFTIENDSEPLSKEALDKVWDVFYRADEARSGGGTGLGLAITKTIVELHGGKCTVQNTKTGVKFGFTI